jgi:hypothetical protein
LGFSLTGPPLAHLVDDTEQAVIAPGTVRLQARLAFVDCVAGIEGAGVTVVTIVVGLTRLAIRILLVHLTVAVVVCPVGTGAVPRGALVPRAGSQDVVAPVQIFVAAVDSTEVVVVAIAVAYGQARAGITTIAHRAEKPVITLDPIRPWLLLASIFALEAHTVVAGVSDRRAVTGWRPTHSRLAAIIHRAPQPVVAGGVIRHRRVLTLLGDAAVLGAVVAIFTITILGTANAAYVLFIGVTIAVIVHPIAASGIVGRPLEAGPGLTNAVALFFSFVAFVPGAFVPVIAIDGSTSAHTRLTWVPLGTIETIVAGVAVLLGCGATLSGPTVA